MVNRCAGRGGGGGEELLHNIYATKTKWEDTSSEDTQRTKPQQQRATPIVHCIVENHSGRVLDMFIARFFD